MREKVMIINYKVYLIDRETGKVGYIADCYMGNDIEQGKIDLMLKHTDEDYIARVRFHSIQCFEF